MTRHPSAVSVLALVALAASVPALAVQRAFVSSHGADANAATSSCSLANPCRSFTAAMGVVDPGGEVVALDAAGYGAVSIAKSVTITANPGFYAGISVSAGNAVVVDGAGINVILRGLNINGIGTAAEGVALFNGNRLSIENCIVSNFGDAGVLVQAAATVRIVDSMIRDNVVGIYLQGGATANISGTRLLGNTETGVFVNGLPGGVTTTAAISDSVLTRSAIGLFVTSSTGATARASITRSAVVNNNVGVRADGGDGVQTVTISGTLVTGNASTGLTQASGTGTTTLRSLGDNAVDQNGTNTSGTITPISGT